ncbi:hypothetical protein ACVBEJ_00185 [Porticoccus sp. GXU_MW_L64]
MEQTTYVKYPIWVNPENLVSFKRHWAKVISDLKELGVTSGQVTEGYGSPYVAWLVWRDGESWANFQEYGGNNITTMLSGLERNIVYGYLNPEITTQPRFV